MGARNIGSNKGSNKRPFIGITGSPEEGKVSIKEDYFRAVWNAGGLPAALSSDCEPDECLSRLDGILIPGGVDLHPSYYGEKERYELKLIPKKRSDFEIALVKGSIKEGKPLLSICYGMQLVNVALGGTLYQDLSECEGAPDHRKGFHFVALNGGSPFLSGRQKVNSFHHQACKKLAPVLDGFAHSEDGVIEGFFLKGHSFLLGVQWHPERIMGEALSKEIFSSFIRASARKEK